MAKPSEESIYETMTDGKYSYDEVLLDPPCISSYDPVSLNFGKPVLMDEANKKDKDIFNSISFDSPISECYPPRYISFVKKQYYENVDLDSLPKVPPRNIILKPESILGARPKSFKLQTLDIRSEVNSLYESAEKELERDLTMDLSILEKDSSIEPRPSSTLIRNFDPIFTPSSSSCSSIDDLKNEYVKEKEENNSKTENLYVTYPQKISCELYENIWPQLPESSLSSPTSSLTKTASNFLKRKVSEKIIKKSPEFTGRRFSLTKSIKHGSLKTHCGVLYLWSSSKKVFGSKWCILGNGNFRYFNDKDSLAIPKECISLSSLTSLSKVPVSTECDGFYCFDIGYSKGRNGSKFSSKMFGAPSSHERETWLEKITQSLSPILSTYTMSQSSRLGWAYLKEGFAGTWSPSWMSLMNRSLSYSVSSSWEVMDLRKTKDISLRKDIKNLDVPKTPEVVSVLVIDFVDRSIYILLNHKRECSQWRFRLENMSFNNGNSLIDQQMTNDDIPVLVDKCIKFIYSYGTLTEGIYRHSGVKTKIDKLLNDFRHNAWKVQLSREYYSEHDVANTLKRFMRTLEEPLLTDKLRTKWMTIATNPHKNEARDIISYIDLLDKLPRVNYNTLRKLISHLFAISAQCDKNLMSEHNLAAIWGPTLLTVDGGCVSGNFETTSAESDVCRDLIIHYPQIFNVNDNELEREKKIMEVFEKINTQYECGQPGHPKRSGDLRMWVYIDTKTSGNTICCTVVPSMTGWEMKERVLKEIKAEKDASYILHEIILDGQLERPIHDSELMLDVTLKWGSWSEADRVGNYLLLKRNGLYAEALPLIHYHHPLSAFGEAFFDSNTRSKTRFHNYFFSMNNANITCYREDKSQNPVELNSWPIEGITWYIGAEESRKPPHRLNITFISKNESVIRTKESPYFGKTISFASQDVFIRWIAAMLTAQYPSEPSPNLFNNLNIH